MGNLLLVDILGVDRHKALASAGGNYLGAKALQDFHQQVAANSRMLINQQPEALQTSALKKIGIASEIPFAGIRRLRA